ncbi:ABC transporter ATP-binding protein [Anaerococcus hydrogenalis]|uniref:ABC transporter ATP-binding protein n=1 Tax=Anaerococcus hydrogenalis TaxID=33029 RepID=A0A2N6UKF6_9FIRM|nr:ATP-binding cassette domain-containing protein [Anaerococcus hydrogenalis]MDK7694244.1 ATP-binding cassette domain-containing protein [Anaerococcus hydrogenalis]MDK7696022.1 ATP-binding cassette domain-containing protein [Anaerococcus hydrogenalis]MDK7707271.1 ATP-binding cassette domain-containing protein [Anaerococcus hydrogenalis]PMC82297.1 ABC transporter ATP-binding protein [Anaerococcus hydrogenalis]
MEKILEIKNLKKSYNNKRVLDIDCLEIKEKSIYGLIGKNGAGKSTLMKIVLGLVKKDEGMVKVFNQEVNGKNQKKLNKNLGALIENPSFYDHLTGYENLEIISSLKGVDKKEISKTLDLVGLKNVEKKKAREYSLGMKQRLGIAIALIGSPKLLILDEPINGLDPQGIEEMRNLFKNIVKNTSTSILISSHILDEIEKISTHIGILKEGKLTYNGSLEEYRRLHPPFISMITSDNKKALELIDLNEDNLKGKKIILGKKSNQEIGEIVNFLHGKVDIYRIEEEKESLEKLFIEESRS